MRKIEKREHRSENNKSNYTPGALLWRLWRDMKPTQRELRGASRSTGYAVLRIGGADESIASWIFSGARRGFRCLVDGRHAGPGEL